MLLHNERRAVVRNDLLGIGTGLPQQHGRTRGEEGRVSFFSAAVSGMRIGVGAVPVGVGRRVVDC